MMTIKTIDQLRLDERERAAAAERRRLAATTEPVRRRPRAGLHAWFRGLLPAERRATRPGRAAELKSTC